MAGVFAELLKKTSQTGGIPTQMAAARSWASKQTSLLTKPSTVISRSTSSSVSSPAQAIGSMVLFEYSATTDKNLPYWDRYPLVFPFAVDSKGMHGINMHYLPLPMRARLMDALWAHASGPSTNSQTQLQLSYGLLQNAARMPYYKPCVKRYLNKGLMSNLVVVPANEWNVALFLPLERFQKASSGRVHEDSRRIIQGR